MSKGSNTALIVAAGKGQRMRAEASSLARWGFSEVGMGKQYLSLCGEPLLAHTLRALQGCDSIHQIVVIVNEGDIEVCWRLVEEHDISKVSEITVGGEERQDSVGNGLRVLPRDTGVVVIHDGARPLILPRLIEEAISALSGWDGVVLGVPVRDTVKFVEGERIVQTLDRSKLWCIQTPQVFPRHLLEEAHERARGDGFYGTDDAVLLERLGYRVRVIMGSYENIKITVPEDLLVAEAILKRRQGS